MGDFIMKKIIIYVLLLTLAMIFLPYGIMLVMNKGKSDFPPNVSDGYLEETFHLEEPENLSDGGSVPMPSSVSVYIKGEDKTVFIDTEEYIKGVVLAEMPSSFNIEALKAQAVAARSCLYYNIEYYKTHSIPAEHKGAVICTDYTHCSAWRDITKETAEVIQKVGEAVDMTKNIVMLYDDRPINAVFHSTSGGVTEKAEDVWGKDIPYLQSVASFGDDLSPKYTSAYDETVQTFKETAEKNIEGTDWNNPIFSDIERSQAGGIISITIGGVKITGTKFRSVYSLLSANADITENDGRIKISVKGYGHGVGMSQYGANYLASNGMSFENILKTYYTGVTIKKI